jgi:hypothetical protein
MFRITRRGRGSGRAPALSVVRAGARLEVREGRYGQGSLYAYCDVDDSLAAHTLLLTFADMRARDIYIHTDIPVISERRFFRLCAGDNPDADSLSDSLSDSDSESVHRA